MEKISDALKRDWKVVIIIVLSFVLGVYCYNLLPNKIPINWNAKGETPGYSNKFYAAFSFPLLSLGLFLLFSIYYYMEDNRKNCENSKLTYQYLKYLLIMFLFAIEIINLLTAKGIIVNRPIFIKIMKSLLFILIGNVMGRFKNNYFMAIKTHWTLTNKQVWKKTHRMAGSLWVIAGVLNMLTIFININVNIMISKIISVVIAIIPIIYSYIVYKKINYVK